MSFSSKAFLDMCWDTAVLLNIKKEVLILFFFLRILFATILTHCEPANPLHLWLKFKNDLCEDFLYERRQLFSKAILNSSDENKALLEIDNYLKQNSMSLSHFKDMPLPDVQQITTNRLIDEEALI